MMAFLFAIFFVVASRAQISLDLPLNPDGWKAKIVAEKKYSLKAKEWIVDFQFTNVSGKKDQILTANGALMYRVKAFLINDAGTRIGEVKTRTYTHFPMHRTTHGHAEPGGVIWTVCDIREWLVIDKPGWYEVQADRLLSMKDANDNAFGLPVEKVMKAAPFKIEVVR